MKIIATTNGGYLVDMTAQEIALAAGFSSTYDDAWMQANGRREPVIGSAIKVAAAYSFHSRVSSHREKCKDAAGFLRGLAEMLENGLPDVLTHEPDATEESKL